MPEFAYIYEVPLAVIVFGFFFLVPYIRFHIVRLIGISISSKKDNLTSKQIGATARILAAPFTSQTITQTDSTRVFNAMVTANNRIVTAGYTIILIGLGMHIIRCWFYVWR